MEVDQQSKETNEWHTVTNARFVMVSRDSMNKGSAIVNKLVPETDEEKALFLKGEGNICIYALDFQVTVRWP
jgi:acyl-CoA hydrolase